MTPKRYDDWEAGTIGLDDLTLTELIALVDCPVTRRDRWENEETVRHLALVAALQEIARRLGRLENGR